MTMFAKSSLVLLSLLVPCAAPAAEVKLVRHDDRVRVELDGKLFTEFVFKGAPKPYFFPVLASDGTAMTVNGDPNPMYDQHHRSLFFAHGEVNGAVFWNDKDETKGRIVNDRVAESASGQVGEIAYRNRWVGPDGMIHLIEETTVRIRGTESTRTLDFDVTLKAPADRPTVMGDTKEGSMAVRLPLWMTPPHSIRGYTHAGKGTIVNAEGIKNDLTWGKRSTWVDYYAPKDGKVYGVAMFDHPSNPRHPTWWHVRVYGLFAANPFGRHDFEALKDQPHVGDLTIPAGESVRFRWRIYFHYGDEKNARIAERFQEYVSGK